MSAGPVNSFIGKGVASHRLKMSRRGLGRAALGFGGALAFGSACQRQGRARTSIGDESWRTSLQELEGELGGRIGVFAQCMDREAPALGYREEERFAMCSTFKWALAATILERSDRGRLDLDEMLSFNESDLLEYAPVARAHLERGALTIGQATQASVTLSDNTAANLLLEKIGGPAELTRFFRSLGDEVTRLDRNEPTLNTNVPGDARDTTTPFSMTRSLAQVLSEDVLAPESRARLTQWLVESETGLGRLRAGFPPRLVAGDKTGTGQRGAANDVAVLFMKKDEPIFVSCYMSGSTASLERLNAAHRTIGQLISDRFVS